MAEKIKVVETPSYNPTTTALEPQLRNSIASRQIDGQTEIGSGTIFADALVVGGRPWIHDLVWTADDYNTVSWTAGTLYLSGGTEFAISLGDTGNISAKTYVYFDETISDTLQTTTDYNESVADGKILLAIVEAASDTDAKAILTALGQTGTTIDGDKIVTGKIQSTDGKTYFDLDNKEIIVNDGTNDRVHLGFDSGGY